MILTKNLFRHVMTLLAFFSFGCGDHDDPGTSATPTAIADPKGKSFNLAFADGRTGTLTFSDGGTYALNLVPAAAGAPPTTETGTYTFSSSSNTQGELVLSPSSGGVATGQQNRVSLVYPNPGATSGSFTSTISSGTGAAQETSSGTFSIRGGLGSAVSSA
jgi:hypothetical protein